MLNQRFLYGQAVCGFLAYVLQVGVMNNLTLSPRKQRLGQQTDLSPDHVICVITLRQRWTTPRLAATICHLPRCLGYMTFSGNSRSWSVQQASSVFLQDRSLGKVAISYSVLPQVVIQRSLQYMFHITKEEVLEP